jgi:hypothetical protein
MIITAIIAPVEVTATSPKLSFSDALLSFLSDDTPNAIARINGTVRAPVVAPEASKEIDMNSEDVKKASKRIIPYSTVSILFSGKLYTILTNLRTEDTAISYETIRTMQFRYEAPDVTVLLTA